MDIGSDGVSDEKSLRFLNLLLEVKVEETDKNILKGQFYVKKRNWGLLSLEQRGIL